MTYDFDEIIDRRGTHALNTDGFRDYIFHAPPDMKFPYADEEFVRMWVADMEFATAPEILEGLRARIDRRIFGYTSLCDHSFQEIFRAWTRRRHGWDFDPATIVNTPGIIPALYDLVGMFCGTADAGAGKGKAIALTPSYAYFKHACDFNGVELLTSDLVEEPEGYRIDFEDLARTAADPAAKVLILCNPHNPTGRVWRPDELRRLGEICLERGLWIISDEIHCDLLRTGLSHTPLASLFPGEGRIITCMAPSKTFNLAGMQFSNLIIPDAGFRARWNERHMPFLNPLSLAAAEAAYTRGDAWLDELRVYLDGNFAHAKRVFAERLPEAVFRISEATYLAWVKIGPCLPGVDDYSSFFAHRAGVLLEGGNMFVAHGEGYLRLNLACPRSMLDTGLARICDAVDAWKKERSC